MTNHPAEPAGRRALGWFLQHAVGLQYLFFRSAFCMQISSLGCSEATQQQISYPPSLILWFIFLMLLPLLHVSSPEGLCSRLCRVAHSKHGRRRVWVGRDSGELHQVGQRRGRSHGMFPCVISAPGAGAHAPSSAV